MSGGDKKVLWRKHKGEEGCEVGITIDRSQGRSSGSGNSWARTCKNAAQEATAVIQVKDHGRMDQDRVAEVGPGLRIHCKESIGSADGLDVGCKRKRSRMTLRFLAWATRGKAPLIEMGKTKGIVDVGPEKQVFLFGQGLKGGDVWWLGTWGVQGRRWL